MNKIKRRHFIKKIGGAAAGTIAAPMLATLITKNIQAAVSKVKHLPASEVAQNEDFWFHIQQAYTSSPSTINLNNGGVSPQPKVVQDAVEQYMRASNEGPAYYMWHVYGKGKETIRTKLANLSGCSPEEITINRNSTESLETIIYGLPMEKGDEVLMCNQDYGSMRNAFYQRATREGIVTKEVKIPVPPKNLDVIRDIFEKAITNKTKYVHVTHMINLTGQILPVKDICKVAHEKGLEVIVDAAHTFAHLDYNIPDLGCDYLGTSLHKWLCAPFGSGMMYIKRDKIEKVWPLFAEGNQPKDNIRKFDHLGTHSVAHELAIGHAINFHNGIGSKRKEERLRYLKNYWAKQLMELPEVYLNTSLDADQSCGLANFGIKEVKPGEITKYLFSKHRIYTIPIGKPEPKAVNQSVDDKKMYPGIEHADIDFEGVRVTPHVYTTIEDLDLFVRGVKDFIQKRK